MRRALGALLLTLISVSGHGAWNVVDDRERQISLADAPQRVVALAPHITELLYAIDAGDLLVAAVDYSDYPEPAQHLPRVGNAMQINLERLLALQPDLAIAWPSGNRSADPERLAALGIPVYLSEPGGLAELPAALRRLGRAVDRSAAAERLAARLEKARARLQQAYGQRPPLRVFVQIWHHPLMTVNGKHYIAQAVRLCGGRPLFAELPELTPQVGREAVLAADPEVILSTGDGDIGARGLASWRELQVTTATRTGNLYTLNPDHISRPTPRLLEGAREICRALELAREKLLTGPVPADETNPAAARPPLR